MEVGACQGASSSGPRSKRRLFIALLLSKVPSLACTTTPCPTAGWPPMTWKGSGVHMPVGPTKPLEPLLAAYSSDCASDRLRARLAGRSPIL
ncbi:unnamed protein product [Spirodela intermedia]|uniref:Secreted protein n=1 Tax=Spirodela intermedia TaxID=51605 RepID=A0ABN7E8A0_SPIIN|nr:unnamed protein product [Spirodela intermedia]